MCLCSSAASSSFLLLEVFNKPGASGNRAMLKIRVMEGTLRSPGFSLSLCLCSALSSFPWVLNRFVREHSWDLNPKGLRNISVLRELGQVRRMLKLGLVLVS